SMQPPPSPQLAARRWLERAERDLAVARLTLTAAPPLLEMSAYHAQQAAEKALKGFLVRHGQAAPKVHDLVPLLAACQAHRWASPLPWGPRRRSPPPRPASAPPTSAGRWSRPEPRPSRPSGWPRGSCASCSSGSRGWSGFTRSHAVNPPPAPRRAR